eukprot:37174-Eustigmatos_ZCMA.PRE.1
MLLVKSDGSQLHALMPQSTIFPHVLLFTLMAINTTAHAHKPTNCDVAIISGGSGGANTAVSQGQG